MRTGVQNFVQIRSPGGAQELREELLLLLGRQAIEALTRSEA